MKTLLFAIGMIVPISSTAGEAWLTIPFASWHADRERVENGKSKGHYEQNNLGAGLEYAFNPKWRLAAGMYRNSIRGDTGYVGLAYMPLHLEDFHMRAGASVGAVSGYSGNLIPVVIPTVSFEGKSVGMNLLVVPPTSHTKTAGVGFQIKFRLP